MDITRPGEELEHEFWIEATVIAKEQGKTLGGFMDEIAEARPNKSQSPASAVRVYILGYLRAKHQALGGSIRPVA